MSHKNKKKKDFFLEKYFHKFSSLKKNFKEKDALSSNDNDYDNSFNTFEVVVIIVISVLFGIIVGCILISGKGNIIDSEVSPELNEFISTYNTILKDYYDSVSEKDLVNAAVSGMINSLGDPYSSYMDSEETESFNEAVDGSYVGIGVTVGQRDGKNCVVDMFKDSPAKKAGMKVNDVFVKVGDKDVTKLSLTELSKLIKGKSGTAIKIVVQRDGKEVDLVVKRAAVEIPSVSSKIIEKDGKKIGYISIDSFAANTFTQFKNELSKLDKKKVQSLILDVRSNPGGHLIQVTKILELFFDKKTVLYQIETKGKKRKVFSTTKDKKTYPIAVLVNSSSASASEILAACFKENYKNVKIIGKTTYGKGTVQQAVELSTGASLKYTTQKWLTPKGNWINEKGVVPDIVVNQSEEFAKTLAEEDDAQLQKAIDVLIKNNSK